MDPLAGRSWIVGRAVDDDEFIDTEVGQRSHVVRSWLAQCYGAVQLAISGVHWLPDGFDGVQLLLLLCLAKIVAASLTIGSGGSAGDFAPSLAVGGLFGGAFGRACQILLDDPRIEPGAFALVGMGTLYGGIAHVPLSALVLVCEMAGSYDLLVEVVAESDDHLLELISLKIRTIPNVESTETFMYLKLQKQTYSWGAR